MTDYIIRNGCVQVFNEPDVRDVFGRIKADALRASDLRRNALLSIMLKYPLVMDVVRLDASLFTYLSECVLLKPYGLKNYRVFYPRAEKTAYTFFVENKPLHIPGYTSIIYDAIKDCDNFSLHEFLKTMVTEIPTYNGFSDADAFVSFFISHIADIEMCTIKDVLKIYNENSQCLWRGRHETDMKEINQYIQNHQVEDLPLNK